MSQAYRIPGWVQLVLLGLFAVCVSIVAADVFVAEANVVLESVAGALFLVLGVSGGGRLLAKFPGLVARKGGK